MQDLTTTYMGIPLKNPIIIGSSGLTSSVERLKALEKNGAAAIVIKSIFEEEILAEYDNVLKNMDKYESNLEYLDYYDYKIKEDTLSKYMLHITEAKKNLSIPVIASINCLTASEWTYYAKKFEEAGADGLELNIFAMPSDFSVKSEDKEKLYFDIIEKVLKNVTIPVALKMSYYFTNLGLTIQRLSKTGIKGLVLFNRFWSPDIDIESKQIISANVLSTPSELPISLRWIALMADRVDCDLAASTGIHDGKAIIKLLLAGAKATQVVSTIYKNGIAQIEKMIKDLETWMQSNKYTNIDQFRGKMSQSKIKNPAEFERVQFMKYFSNYNE
jgi:dihydroorotate dehydrogenase (fumarate)